MNSRVVDWLSCLGYSLLVCGDSIRSFLPFQQALKHESSRHVKQIRAQPFPFCLGCFAMVQNWIVLRHSGCQRLCSGILPNLSSNIQNQMQP